MVWRIIKNHAKVVHIVIKSKTLKTCHMVMTNNLKLNIRIVILCMGREI